MELIIKSIHFDITDRLTAFINKKIDKITRRYEAVQGCEVILKVVKPETAMNKEASVKFEIPGTSDLFASKTADTFEEAIDLCLEALEKPLERVKDRK